MLDCFEDYFILILFIYTLATTQPEVIAKSTKDENVMKTGLLSQKCQPYRI